MRALCAASDALKDLLLRMLAKVSHLSVCMCACIVAALDALKERSAAAYPDQGGWARVWSVVQRKASVLCTPTGMPVQLGAGDLDAGAGKVAAGSASSQSWRLVF